MRVRSAGAAFIFASCLLLTAACDSPEEREAQHIESGKTLSAAGDYAKAAIEFRNALQINSTRADTKYLLGEVLEKQGNLPAALAAFQEVSFQDPENRQAQIKLGQFALMNGDSVAAIRYADKAIASDPQQADAYTMKAAALVMQKKFAESEAEIQKSLARAPGNDDALIILASQRMLEGRAAEAEKLIADNIRDRPDSAMLLAFQAKMLRDMGRPDDAETALRRLITMQPDVPEHVLMLANDLRGKGRYDEAKQLFRDSLAENAAKERILDAYASFLQQRESPDAVVAEIAALSGLFADSNKYPFLLARLNIEAKSYQRAADILQNLLKKLTVQEEKLDVRAELARIEILEGNRVEAAKQLDQILAEDKEQHNALLLRANIALDDRRYEAAVADARSALNTHQNSPGALTILWRSYALMGERSLAIDTLRTLTKITPADLEAHLQLAGLLIPQATEEALEHLDAAIALAPDQPELRLKKAQALIYSKQESRGEEIGLAMLQDPLQAAIGHQILGESAYARKDFAMAASEFEAALAAGRSFDEIGPKLTQALAFQESGGDGSGASSGDAVQMLEQRISRNPKDSLSFILLANLRQNAGDLKGAEQALRRAIEADPDNAFAHISLSRVLRQDNRIEEMTAALARAERQFPQDRAVQESAAVGREIAGEFDAARAAYERVLQTWPDSLVAANNLAQLIADTWPDDREQLNRARQQLEKFRGEDNPAVLDTLGWVQTRLGNTEEAIILLERATSLSPDSRDALYHYGTALAQKGLTDKAKATLGKALAGGATFRGSNEARALLDSLK